MLFAGQVFLHKPQSIQFSGAILGRQKPDELSMVIACFGQIS